MIAALLFLMPGDPAVATDAAPPELRCLPGEDGFLTMRLRGSIEEDIRWTEPDLACTGMLRPDGRGLRLRFSGKRGGGDLAVVFAAPELDPGASGHSVPVNVTLIDSAGERIYGTQGDSRCVLDKVEQQPLEGAPHSARSFRVAASGFCIAPARAIDGDGSVLPTRFDFAGFVTIGEHDAAALSSGAGGP